MNCIFCCVFNQEKYVDMFFLFLESIFIYGNLDENTIVLVYTSTSFMNIIKKSHLFNDDKIKFEINDTYNDIDKSCKARLDLFNLPSITKYDKILYLDTDILVKDDINKVFNVCEEDILYVLEEGVINSDSDFWGKTLFGDEINNYNDKTAFTSGILLFNNCEKIKDLFIKINEDIVKRPYNFTCYDQPYIVYNAFKYNLYNNKILKSLVINNDNNIYSDKVIHHFPGGPGVYQHKIDAMTIFLNSIKDFTIINNINRAQKYINDYLLPIINNCGEKLEGNIFMLHHTSEYTDVFLNKSKNISNLVLNKNIKNVMEIGFNSGFSTLLMLLSNPNMRINCFDLGEHKYTIPCYEKLRETFGDRINITIGDSTKTLQNVDKKFDLIHIDGGHSTEVADCDIINSYRLSKQGTILIMDDYDFYNLHPLWDSYIKKYNLKPLNIHVYPSPHHDVKYVDIFLKIAPVLFQTAKIKAHNYVLEMIKTKLGNNWKYEFYNDDDIIQFFINNPIEELPNIIDKFNYINKGQHKADLFRYYYLYVRGGIFMDSDAMIYSNIEDVVKDYDFISVTSSSHPGKIFQGILGASPKNKIIKRALYEAYNTDPNILDNYYHHFCEQLSDIIKQNDYGYKIKLYEERRNNSDGYDDILDGNTVLFKHYWKNKVIPENKLLVLFDTDWNNYKKSELNNFDYRILNTYTIPNALVRVGPNADGGYVIADGFDYDLFISCGIANDIRFEEAFLDIHKIKCIAFDGTISSFPSHRNSMEWISKNIGFSNTEKTTNLKEYFKNSKKIFLKMDIEGSEFNWLDSMTEEEFDNFSQIVLEVHWPFDVYRMNMLKKLNNTHYIIHIHGNNYCDRDIPKHLPSGRTYDGTVTINNSILPQIKLPEVFEVTYINKKLCDNSLVEMKQIQNPTILDYPNNPAAQDIYFSIPVITKQSLECLKNKTYTWENSYITFLDNFKMDAFGEGHYTFIDKYTIIAHFGGRVHNIKFNEDYTSFSSIRQGDLQIVIGTILN
jgi:hypothetical protein